MRTIERTDQERLSLSETVLCPDCGRSWEREGYFPQGRPQPCPACRGDQLSRERVGCLVYLDDLAWARWLLLADRLQALDRDYEVEDYGFKWEYFYLHVRTADPEAQRLVQQFERRVNRATDRAGDVARDTPS